MNQTETFGLSMLFVWIVDWAIKAAKPWLWGGWVPHAAHRSLWTIPICAVLLVFIIALLNTRALAISGGIAFGGLCANLIDLSINGQVWNMFPVPLTDGLWCNLADFAIIGGLLVFIMTSAKSAGTKFASPGGTR